jgi:hypothetical protein
MTRAGRPCVAAIYPNPKGFAFVIFEGPSRPMDWGLKEANARRRNAHCVKLAQTLLSQYRPQVLIVEEPSTRRSRRCERICRLNRSLRRSGERLGIDVHLICRAEVRQCFSEEGARTKFEVATAISKRFACFEHWLPPARKPWMAEDTRMSVFDAAAFALAYYRSAGGDRQAPP